MFLFFIAETPISESLINKQKEVPIQLSEANIHKTVTK